MVTEGGSSSSSTPANQIKTVKFALGRGNRTDGKLIVVHKRSLQEEAEVSKGGTLRGIREKPKITNFVEQTIRSDEFLGTTLPKVMISVTGAAANFPIDPKLEQIFCQGLIKAAKSTTAWVVSGGTDVGVMRLVGEANRKFVTDVPTIGFATYSKVHNKELLKSPDKAIEYDATAVAPPGQSNLNPNHTHFVLIDSDIDNFGEEIEARSDFEEYMCTTYQLPLCLIVVNGGPGTLRTVAEGALRKFSVVVFEGTGRAADAIAREVRRKQKLPFEHLEPMNLNNEQLQYMNQIVDNSDYVTLYSAEDGPFDLEVLKAILSSAHGSLLKKLELAIQWNRVDLAEHLLNSDNPDKPVSPDEINATLSKALELSLDLEKPDLFRFLADKGAKKTDIDLSVLYTEELPGGKPIIDPLIARYAPHIPARKNFTVEQKSKYARIPANEPLLADGRRPATETSQDPKLKVSDITFIKEIFRAVDPMFYKYARSLKQKLLSSNDLSVASPNPDGSLPNIHVGSQQPAEIDLDKSGVGGEDSGTYKVKYTDAMLWAILTGKLELAKAIWEKTALPVHTALIASGLCKGVARWLLNEAVSFTEAAEWFEGTAVQMLDKLDYPSAQILLTFDYPEFGYDTLKLAVKTECKDFVSHRHVQRHLDGLLYADKHGGIPPGTNFFSVVLCIFMPFLLYVTKTYDNPAPNKHNGKWYHFYALPYTKFWTNTLCYLGYLVLLAVVLVGFQGIPRENPDGTTESAVSGAEILLWVWMLGIGIEEISQAQAEGWSYFKYNSNRMDIFILIIQATYFSLAISWSALGDPNLLVASTDLLIVATIISYVRFLDVFSISKELGPLYVVLQKIMWDVFKWIFVFILFAVSFQVSFMALTTQIPDADPDDKWKPTIDGGSFWGAYFTIIGDWNTTMDVLKDTKFFGAFLVSIYALIAQVMLVNLLIAMMGDTFNNVKENSDKEWKFSRYSLIVEYTSTSFHPPPFNIVVIPIKKAYYLFHKKTAIDYTELDMQEAITIKQREQFKNLMKDAKEDLLDDNAGEELNTLASVSEHVRENFKTLIDEQEIKYKSIDAKLTDLAAKTQAITINSGSGSGMASLSNDLKMEINHAQEVVNTAVKQEIATLQRNILEALKTAQAPPVETATVVVQNREIPVTWAPGVKSELIPRVLREYKPFQEWNTEISKPDNAAHLTVQSIHIQNIDQFGPRIGFVKFQAIVKNHAGQNVAGIVFMRGGSVGMLVVLRLDDPESPDHGKEYTIVTVQPRVPCGAARFTEIPAGMLDGGHFAGVAAKELREETGIDIQEEALIDLTGLAYNGNHRGMFPSAGGCDEVIGLFLYRTSVTREQLESYQDKLTGVAEENEVICLKVLPLDQLWLEAPDAKALAALYLYQALSAKGVIPTDY